MQVVHKLSEWCDLRDNKISDFARVGFVPTMGNLHVGHGSLLKRSARENNVTILSIFVNKTQFNERNDYETYPITTQDDLEVAEGCKVDYVLMPSYQALFQDDFSYRVIEKNFSNVMEGACRKNHFSGVLTVMLKLLLLVKPSHLYLGEKDYQQLILIQDMVKAFFLPIQIVACETVRDQNGVALSSRNSRLTTEQKILLTKFSQLLSSTLPIEQIVDQLTKLGFIVDYIIDRKGRRFGAVRIGEVRLIDNIVLF